MDFIFAILLATGLYALASGAHAAQVIVDFDGLDGGRNALLERPAAFYNGGLGSMGSGPGSDYGITFRPFDATSTEPRAICNVTFASMAVPGTPFSSWAICRTAWTWRRPARRRWIQGYPGVRRIDQ